MAKLKVGILTSGGDCPGLNATIRGAAKGCYELFGEDKVEIIGIQNGYHGLIRLHKNEAIGLFGNSNPRRYNSRNKENSL